MRALVHSLFFLCFFYVVRKIRPYFVPYVNSYVNRTQTIRKQCANSAHMQRKTTHMSVLRGTCAEAIFFCVFFARCLRHSLRQTQNKALFWQNKALRVGLHKLRACVTHRPRKQNTYESVKVHNCLHLCSC